MNYSCRGRAMTITSALEQLRCSLDPVGSRGYVALPAFLAKDYACRSAATIFSAIGWYIRFVDSKISAALSLFRLRAYV